MQKTTKKKRFVLWTITILVVLVIVARLWLPTFILKEVNHQLKQLEDYEGSVDDINLFLIAGEYSIVGVELNKKGGKVPVPFFSAEQIDLSVEWKALFRGKVVGEIIVESPKLNYVAGPSEETSQTSVDSDWTKVVDSLMPLKINRFQINNGEIHYRDFHSDPKIDILADHVEITAINLTNAKNKNELLPSVVEATAKVYDGLAHVNMRLDPLNQVPTFDLNAELTTFSLPHLNNFLRAYGNFDVSKGSFSLYLEAASAEKKIKGYIKPIMKDVEVAAWKDDSDFFQSLWESAVSAVGWVFENKPEEQVATQIPFEGNLEDPNVDIWTLVGQVLRNAFIQALYPSLEHSVSIGEVGKDAPETEGTEFLRNKNEKEEKEGFFDKLFGGEENE